MVGLIVTYWTTWCDSFGEVEMDPGYIVQHLDSKRAVERREGYAAGGGITTLLARWTMLREPHLPLSPTLRIATVIWRTVLILSRSGEIFNCWRYPVCIFPLAHSTAHSLVGYSAVASYSVQCWTSLDIRRESFQRLSVPERGGTAILESLGIGRGCCQWCGEHRCSTTTAYACFGKSVGHSVALASDPSRTVMVRCRRSAPVVCAPPPESLALEQR